MYKSVAEKANQLSKVIEQEHPELIKSGLSYNYFTAVQWCKQQEQDAAMRRQFNPKDVDKMTNLMRGVVSLLTQRIWRYRKNLLTILQFKMSLWQTASQGLYAALGSNNFKGKYA